MLIAMEFLNPIATIMASLATSVFSRLKGCVRVKESIESLEDALVELLEARDDLKMQVDRAERRGLTCTNQVKGWLQRVEKVEVEVRSILQDVRQEKKCLCFSNHSEGCFSRYKVSRKVAEKLLMINDLKGKGTLDVDIADGLLLVPVVEIPCRLAIGLDLMLETVKQLLNEETIGIIGIYGMGGVGKTTLLKSINNGFLTSKHDFNVVIWAVVSKDFSVEKIQQAIGLRLGLSWDDVQFQELLASRIHNIMKRTKFLLLLDDVWERVDLEKIGIPLFNKDSGSKVIFTTRSQDICSDNDAHSQLKLHFLNDDKSWELFEEKAGGSRIFDSSPLILKYAQEIVRKCGGLPLALITIGWAMANKETEEEWEYVMEVLKWSPSALRGMEDVFMLLKFSYDNLANDVNRLCLLYCALFPPDYFIEKEQLIGYWVGEGFLDSSLNNGNNLVNKMGHAIIGSLKVACFLEAGEVESQVIMHDVVRNFCLWIASDTGLTKGKFLMLASAGLTKAPNVDEWSEVGRISLLDNEITELVHAPVCPHLSTLLLQWNSGMSRISHEFFKFMPNLKVLDLSSTSIRVIPRSICHLVELRHLDLSRTNIRALPKELGQLAKLRHLDIQRNQYLNRIPSESIVCLSELRVLNLYYSYRSWRTEDPEGEEDEVNLSNLEQLGCLATLGLTVSDLSSLKVLSRSRILSRCIQSLYIRECEGLFSLQPPSDPSVGEKLRRLSINNCSDFEYLEIDEGSVDNCLQNLEVLALHGLPSMVTVWMNPVGQGSLQNLRSVNFWYCDKLKSVSWVLRLPKLEMIYLFYCQSMEEVIQENEVEEQDYCSNAFARLKIISIRNLPRLRSISHKALPFPSLKKVAVIDCPNLNKLPLKAHDISELPTVYCEKDWWDKLEWDDPETKSILLPHFLAD